MKRFGKILEKFIFRFFAYPFCVFIILMGMRMVFDTPDYEFDYLEGKAFFSGIGVIVIASLYLVADFLLLLKSFKRNNNRLYIITFFIIQFLVVYYFFFSDSTVEWGINKTVGWAWDFTNYLWLGLVCVLIVALLVYNLIKSVLKKRDE